MKKKIPLILALATALLVQAIPALSVERTERKIGINDAEITKTVARFMQEVHFKQEKLDEKVAKRFLNTYIDTLDSQRIFFLESDEKQFQVFIKSLPYNTLKVGNVQIAHRIFEKFMDRLEENYAFANKTLDEGEFKFDGDERYLINRREADRPKNKIEQHDLWRDRLRNEYLLEKLNETKPEEIVDILKRRYSRIRRTFNEMDGDDVLQLYLSSLTRAYDPHSDYMGRHQLENFEISMKLSLHGIGALLSSPDGTCEIVRVMPGGPAEKSKKIHAKDKIIAVAQGKDGEPVDVVDMPLRKVVDLIRGKKGTTVKLTIIPADSDASERKVINIVRDEIPLEDSEATAQLIEMYDDQGKKRRLGLIDLPSFYADFDLRNENKGRPLKSTTADVTKLIKRLTAENIEGLILDFRRNGGGSLEEAVKLTGLFIDEGPVVLSGNGKRITNVERDTDSGALYDGPLMVLTSRFSASASEIVAGALKDYERALIVGESSTHGKGTVQQLLELTQFVRPKFDSKLSSKERAAALANFKPGAIKLTVRKFYLPSGHSTQLKGVKPDVILPSVNNHAEIGEEKLENPIPWSEVPEDQLRKAIRRPLDKLARVAPYVDALNANHKRRITDDQDFLYIAEDIERYKKLIADKTVSLNEEVRRKEKKEAKDRLAARKAEILAREDDKVTGYEFTLKNVSMDGLPDPIDHTKPKAHSNGEAAKEEVTTAADDAEAIDAEAEEERLPPMDVAMKEARRIMLDYIALQIQDGTITAKTSAPIR